MHLSERLQCTRRAYPGWSLNWGLISCLTVPYFSAIRQVHANLAWAARSPLSKRGSRTARGAIFDVVLAGADAVVAVPASR
jgi:hypothetical protein